MKCILTYRDLADARNRGASDSNSRSVPGLPTEVRVNLVT